jgi:NUMOD4 motif
VKNHRKVFEGGFCQIFDTFLAFFEEVKMEEERWKTIPEFPNYEISDLGRIYNVKNNYYLATCPNNFGHMRVSLTSEWGREARFSRSVALLVAEAFVEKPKNVPHVLCDHVILLDGDLTNVAASNLAWRPRWFAWKYSRQLRINYPLHYLNLLIHNITRDINYDCIVEAGIREGLLFEQIWRSTYAGIAVFPTWDVFEVVGRKE